VICIISLQNYYCGKYTNLITSLSTGIHFLNKNTDYYCYCYYHYYHYNYYHSHHYHYDHYYYNLSLSLLLQLLPLLLFLLHVKNVLRRYSLGRAAWSSNVGQLSIVFENDYFYIHKFIHPRWWMKFMELAFLNTFFDTSSFCWLNTKKN